MSLALITGVSGFIGSQVALHVLKAGYRVRLVIRREEQADKIRQILSDFNDKLEFTVIPDLTVTGCFDESLKDVEYVLHLASPLPSSGDSDLLTPAIRGTVSILESALNVPTVKKAVITASVASLIPLDRSMKDYVVRENNDLDLNVDHDIVPTLPAFNQYRASKIASYKATIDFFNNNKPHFDVVTLHPVFVFGRNLVQETAAQLGGSCGMLFQSLFSEKPTTDQFLGVHIDDVADAHVKALDDSVHGFQSYLLSAPRKNWIEVDAFVRKQYPGVPFKLVPEDIESYDVDASKAERELGMTFKPMEVQVKDLLDQQFELRKGL